MMKFFKGVSALSGTLLVVLLNGFLIVQSSFAPVSASVPPFLFVQNEGQWEENVHFRAEIPGGFLYVESNALTFVFLNQDDLRSIHDNRFKPQTVGAHSIRYKFPSSHINSPPEGIDPSNVKFNFFTGNKPDRWAGGVTGYREIKMHNIYPNINLVLYSKNNRLKYDFVVMPEGDPAKIQYEIEGTDSLYLKNNKLFIDAGFASFYEGPPVVFQETLGEKDPEVHTEYTLNGNKVGYAILDDYDPARPLIIDPELIFSTFSGSRGNNFGYTATYDEAENGYAGGTVFDHGFPVTTGAFQLDFKGGSGDQSEVGDIARNAGILKFSADGTNLLYATYLGGGEGNEDPHSMVVNSQNQLVVFGNTTSSDFPVTPGAFDTTFNDSSDIFVSVFSSDGTQLIGSTFIGGSGWDGRNGRYRANRRGDYVNLSPTGYNFGDVFRGEVIVDEDDNVILATVTGSEDFPVTTGAFQTQFGGGSQDGCIIKLSPDAGQLLWSSFLGGDQEDAAFGVTIHENGNLFVTGATASENFVTTPGVIEENYPGGVVSGFITSINPDGTSVEASTFIGTNERDLSFLIQTGPGDYIYIAGQTEGNYPVDTDIYHQLNSGQFIDKLAPDLQSRDWSTVFGTGRGAPDISPSAFLVDDCGRIYYSGWGGQTNNFPEGPGGSIEGLEITPNAIQTENNGSGFYTAVWTPDMGQLLYATYMGSMLARDHVDGGTSRFDEKGNVYQSVCSGCGGYSDFPTTEDAWSVENPALIPGSTTDGGCNNALYKIQFSFDIEMDYEIDECERKVKLYSLDDNALSHHWELGDGTVASGREVEHQYTEFGTYEIMLITNYNNPCADTLMQTIDLNVTRPDDLVIPNIFSPDGDEINDTYFIIGLEQLHCDDYHFLLYNRWGNKILDESGEAFEWDGKINGEPAEPGTYYYIFRSAGIEEAGTITIVR